jgi:surface carbohydrate biosynthesis protein
MSIPILFPIEVTSRELDARLLLAGYCAGENRSIFVGQDRSIYRLARRWRGGVYVGKQLLVGGMKPNLTKYRVLKDRGFRVLFLAEEEPVFSPEDEFDQEQFLQMFHPDWLDSDDIVCAWGEFSGQVFRRVAGNDSPRIEVTGHPRFDLCKPRFQGIYERESQSIRERFGTFALLNTKFALASNAPAFASVKEAFSAGKGSADETAEFWLQFFCYHSRLQADYISLANRLRKDFPDMNIVVRPHPGEDPVWYQLALSGIPGVRVLTEGAVLPWLSEASVLVHTGCTTALEGFQLTPKILQFAPPVEHAFEQDLPSVIGRVCETENEVVSAIHENSATILEDQARERIERIIANFSPETVSCERIAALVNEVVQTQLKHEQTRRGRAAEVEHRLRSALPSRTKAKSGVGGGVPQKFEPLTEAVLDEKVGIVSKLVGKRLAFRMVSSSVVEVFED